MQGSQPGHLFLLSGLRPLRLDILFMFYDLQSSQPRYFFRFPNLRALATYILFSVIQLAVLVISCTFLSHQTATPAILHWFLAHALVTHAA